jgi:hypothetical protein
VWATIEGVKSLAPGRGIKPEGKKSYRLLEIDKSDNI